MVIGLGFVLIGVIFVAVAFVRSSGSPSDASTTTLVVPVAAPGLAPGTTAPLGGAGLGEGMVTKEVSGRTPLHGFGEVSATIVGENGRICQVCLLSATDALQRERGLMEVTDPELGGYDGMLFEFPSDQDGAFWMRNTPMPLSIAFFDKDGKLISTADMEPCCDRGDCPGYPAAEPFAYALEVPQGMLDEVGAVGDATLHIQARRCPLASGS